MASHSSHGPTTRHLRHVPPPSPTATPTSSPSTDPLSMAEREGAKSLAALRLRCDQVQLWLARATSSSRVPSYSVTNAPKEIRPGAARRAQHAHDRLLQHKDHAQIYSSDIIIQIRSPPHQILSIFSTSDAYVSAAGPPLITSCTCSYFLSVQAICSPIDPPVWRNYGAPVL